MSLSDPSPKFQGHWVIVPMPWTYYVRSLRAICLR